VGRNAPRFVAGEQVGRRSASGLSLEIDVGERLPVSVADDEAGVDVDGPELGGTLAMLTVKSSVGK
jgi:hypothetical protein